MSSAPPTNVSELIWFVRQQKDYSKTITESEQFEFRQIIIDLWKFLIAKYENSIDEEEQKNLALLSGWIVFVPELSEVYTKLILQSCKCIDKTRYTYDLLEHLVALMSNGNPITTAKAIGDILPTLNFRGYISDSDQENIKDLVLFLFVNGQDRVAADFCNAMAAVHQQFFLREIYHTEMTKKIN